jgi:hypothetical protein
MGEAWERAADGGRWTAAQRRSSGECREETLELNELNERLVRDGRALRCVAVQPSTHGHVWIGQSPLPLMPRPGHAGG